MTIRNLDQLLAPKSVALIGASREEGSVGLITARNLLRGGFAGPVWLVNPKYRDIEGHPCHPSIAALPARTAARRRGNAASHHPRRHRRARQQGDARRRRDHGGRSRRPQARHARSRPPLLPAHPGPELPRADGAGAGPQRRLLARGAACGRPCVPVAIGRPHHGHRRLGAGTPHRLLARRLARRHGRRRLRRPPRLSRRRCEEPRHPALHGSGDARAEVPLGGAPGRAQPSP